MSGASTACPPRDRLLSLLEDSVAEPERSHGLDHVRSCPRCSAEFARMANSWSMSDLARGESGIGSDSVEFERRLRASPPDSRPPPAEVCEAPPVIPGYDDITLHTSGGMATIYRARDTASGRSVAIKLLSSYATQGSTGRQRALREARLLARLAHPRVVAIYATGVWQGRPYLVLEWIDGCTLQDRIDEATLDPCRAAAIALEVAETLVGLHDAGIVHRDLKPANVLLAAPPAGGLVERVKLIDFGLARPDDASQDLTVGDTILGTPSYMAAEQTCLDPSLGEVSPATDLHGVGGLLFAMLTGHAPYKATSAMASLQRAVRANVAGWERLDGVPDDLRAIVRKCLRADPSRRYSSAADLAADLAAFLGTGRPGRPQGWLTRLGKKARSGWGPVAGLAAAATLLAAGAVPWAGRWSLRPSERTDPQGHSALAAAAVPQASVNAGVAAEPDEIERGLFGEINRVRQEAGLPELRLDERLTQAARLHAANMLRHDRVAHLLDGETFGEHRIGPSGYRCAFAHQEVFREPAKRSGDSARTLDPGTRAELLNKQLRDAGVGVVMDSAGRAWEVLLLAVPAGS